MTEAIQTVSELSPLAAVVVIAGLAATIITQVAKRPGMTKGRAQLLAAGVSVVLGAAAYIVSGIAGVFPPNVVEAVSTGVIVIAAVALTSRAAYSIVGRAIPDGRETLTAEKGPGDVYTVTNTTTTPEAVLTTQQAQALAAIADEQEHRDGNEA
ncbi:MAG: hypothetical protein ACTH6A_09740 [Brachybacterium tyrofermentans]|uniref:hypothetical protein n=1 Tax=Brachybacterium tyrofermentans TaxID=47848 RepID=UPI003F8DBBA5